MPLFIDISISFLPALRRAFVLRYSVTWKGGDDDEKRIQGSDRADAEEYRRREGPGHDLPVYRLHLHTQEVTAADWGADPFGDQPFLIFGDRLWEL